MKQNKLILAGALALATFTQTAAAQVDTDQSGIVGSVDSLLAKDDTGGSVTVSDISNVNSRLQLYDLLIEFEETKLRYERIKEGLSADGSEIERVNIDGMQAANDAKFRKLDKTMGDLSIMIQDVKIMLAKELSKKETKQKGLDYTLQVNEVTIFGDEKSASLYVDGTNYAVKENDTLFGFEITSIKPDYVIVTRNGQKLRINTANLKPYPSM